MIGIQTAQTQRRWLKSVIADSARPLPSFPWIKGQNRATGPAPDALMVQTVRSRDASPRGVSAFR